MTGGVHLLGLIGEAERHREDLYAEAERERRAHLAQPQSECWQLWLGPLAVLALVVGLMMGIAAGPDTDAEAPPQAQASVVPAERVSVEHLPDAWLLDPAAARQVDASRW